MGLPRVAWEADAAPLALAVTGGLAAGYCAIELRPLTGALALLAMGVALSAVARPPIGLMFIAALLPLERWGLLAGSASILKILVVLTGCGWAWREVAYARDRRMRMQPLDWIMAYYAAVLCLGAFRDVPSEATCEKAVVSLAPVVLYALCRVIATRPERVRGIATCLILGALGVALYGIYASVLHLAGPRSMAGFPDPNRYGSTLAALCAFGVALAAASGRGVNLAGGVLFILLTAATAASASRTGIMVWLIVVIAGVALRRTRRATLIVGALAAIIAALLAPPALWARLPSAAVWRYDPGIPGSGGAGRQELHVVATRALGDSPLLGMGRQRFITTFDTYTQGLRTPRTKGQPMVAHNTWLELGIIGGVLAMALFTGALVLAVRRAFAAHRLALEAGQSTLAALALGAAGTIIAFAAAGLFLGAQDSKYLFLIMAIGPCTHDALRPWAPACHTHRNDTHEARLSPVISSPME